MKKAPFRCFSFIYNQNNHSLFILLPCRTFELFIKQLFSHLQHHSLLLKDSLPVSVWLNQFHLLFTSLEVHWIRLRLRCFKSIQLYQKNFLLHIVHWFCWFFLELDQFSEFVLMLVLMNCFKNWLQLKARWMQIFKQIFIKLYWSFFSLVFLLPFWTTYEINENNIWKPDWMSIHWHLTKNIYIQ